MGAIDNARVSSVSDSKNAYGTCPLKEEFIQLLPVRYALVEKDIKEKAIDSLCSELVKFRPVGVRPIPCSGYIYIWHPKNKQHLYSYSVDESSAVSFIENYALNNEPDESQPVNIENTAAMCVSMKSHIYILFSRAEISIKLKNQLINSEIVRKRVMQRVDINNYICEKGTKHLLSPEKLSSSLADCHPKDTDGDDKLLWCWSASEVENYDANKILQHIDDKYKQSAAVVILEDPIGIMTELASSFLSVVDKEEQWYEQDNNRAKYFAAIKIKALIEVGKKQFNEKARNEKINKCINSDLDNLKNIYIQYTEKQNAFYEKVKSKTSKGNYLVSIDDIRSTNEFIQFSKAEDQAKQYAKKYSIEYKELVAFFMRVKTENNNILHGKWAGLTGDRGVLDRIRYDDMDKWFKSATKEINYYEDRLDQLDSDRVSMLRPAYNTIAVYDKEDEGTLLDRLKLENHWLIQLGQLEENRDTARKFFFGELGEQNLQVHTSNDELVATIEQKKVTLKELDAARKKAGKIKSKYDDLKKDNESKEKGEDIKVLQTYKNLLAGRNIIELKNMSEKVKSQLNKLGGQFSRLSIIELQDVAQGMKNTESAVKGLSPGLAAMLIGHKNASGVKFEAGTSVDNSDIREKFSQLDKSILNYKNYGSERDKIFKSGKKANGVVNKLNEGIAKEYYTIKKLVKELDLQVNPLSKESGNLPKGYLSVKASGNTLSEVDSFLKERRKILMNEFAYGNGEGFKIHKPGGAVKNGSLGLVLLYTSYNNFNKVICEYKHHSNISINDFNVILNSFFSLAASINSLISQAITFIAVKNLISNYVTENVSRFSKVTSLASLSSAGFLSVSSMTDGFIQYNRIEKALRNGDIGKAVSSSLVLIGDGIQGSQTSYLFAKGIYRAYQTRNWLTVSEILQVGARINPWSLFATVLIYGGNYLYNYFSSTPLMKWISESVWGYNDTWFVESNKDWDYKEQLLHWVEATQLPKLIAGCEKREIKYHISSSGILGGVANNDSYYVLNEMQIFIPLSANKKVKISAILVRYDGSYLDITKDVLSKNVMFSFDGINSTYNIKLNFNKKESFKWLELLVDLETEDGLLLYTDDGGLRYTININSVNDSTPVESISSNHAGSSDDWFNISKLEADDEQSVNLRIMRNFSSELTIGNKD